jgi:predicted DNA-binding transcriptional regulator AlpA
MTSDALASGYRFRDLVRSRIVSSRSDLFLKQKDFGFPKPVKLSARAAWWPAEEIHDWLKTRTALRDNPNNPNDDRAAPAKPRKSKSVAAE